MSPEISTTGIKDAAFRLKILPGEAEEAGRGKAINSMYAASNYIDLEDPDKAKEALVGGLGMDTDSARALVDAAMNKREGIAVQFRTVFLEKDKEGGRRTYENFELTRDF